MSENKVECLGRDRMGNASSGPRVKTGPNRGRRHVERGGKWTYVDGYTYEARASEKSPHHCWSKRLIEIGFRVGVMSNDGVRSYYIWVPDMYALRMGEAQKAALEAAP